MKKKQLCAYQKVIQSFPLPFLTFFMYTFKLIETQLQKNSEFLTWLLIQSNGKKANRVHYLPCLIHVLDKSMGVGTHVNSFYPYLFKNI